jgi:membrane protease YdiL (CAAX protease family)
MSPKLDSVITNDSFPPPIQPGPEPADIHQASSIPATAPSVTPAPNAWMDVVKAFLAWVGSIGLLVLVPVVAVIPYFIYLGATTGLPTAQVLMQDKTFVFISLIAVIPAHVLTVLGVWILISKWGRLPFWQTLKFSWPPNVLPWQGIAISCAIAIMLLGFGLLITSLLGGGQKTDLDVLIESSFAARIATAFMAVATAPLAEEIIYRGMLYPAIQRLLGMGWAVVVVSIMFAGVHVFQYKNNIGVIIVITILSITLTLTRAWTDRLLPSVVIHTIFNGLQSLYLVLEPFVQKPEKVQPAPALIQLFHTIQHFF